MITCRIVSVWYWREQTLYSYPRPHQHNILERKQTCTLARISSYMNLPKRRIIMKPFIISQFGYCSLIWMFHSRRLSNKIYSNYERALRITCNDRKSHCVKSVQIQAYFWSVFFCIRIEYGDLRSKSPYSIRIQENTDQK